MLRLLFWFSVTAIIYTYLGYPLAVWALARCRRRAVRKAAVTPSVSVVIACHNEARNIEARLRNLLACDYPQDRLEIIVVSDGSADMTADIARRFAPDRVRVFAYERQRGKAVALNVGVEMAAGEVVVFADARQRFERGAIRQLVANFADPTVGAASGELLLAGSAGVGESVGLYWKYEKWIRKNESRFDSVVGATGAIYAIRKRLWRPLPPTTILDDVYTPMRIAMSGHRVVFEEQARAYDQAATSARREFARKVRTLMGNYQLCQLMPRLLVPTSALLLQFYSHKLLRLVAPLFFLLLFAVNVAILNSHGATWFYGATLAAQAIFYACVAAGAALLKRQRKVRLLNFAYVF
ncbi:MAG TPA: glycosyltransferase family 2 protein, partial [Blastocatellia bacterium]|nr:glycosyltransferase family 2 protein [Blastocatellia bacterium]